MPDFSRTINTTISKYLREVEPEILRRRVLLAKLQSMGRVSYGYTGLNMVWRVRYKRAPITGYAEGDTITFARQDKWKTAELDYRGYTVSDARYKMEGLKNRGDEAIVKVWAEAGENLVDDIEDQFGDELYIDGNAAGNTRRLHGLESFFSVSGASASAPIGVNNDTYAGLSTALANYGGSWTGTWPSGTGDAHYDFWTPLVVDYTSTVATASGGWASATKTWANTCREALRFGIIKTRKNKSRKGMMDLGILNDELYRLFEEKVEANERVMVQSGNRSTLYNLGFEDVIRFEGVEFTFEYGVPASTGYGLCSSAMELCSMQDQLFVPTGPVYNETDQSDRLTVDFYGNMKFQSLRSMVKWKNIT